MADLPERQINSNFQGLVSTCVIFAVVGSISAITYESLRQLRRLPRTRFSKFWRKDADLRHSPGGVQDNPAHARHKHTCEDWEMGHFYLSRVFHASTPSPMLPRWPFAWVKLAISFTDEWYADHTGMDTVVYVRFLRACLFWVLLHCFTTAPILLSIHITFSRGTSTTDMQRASLSYLVNTPAPDCTEQDRSKCKLLPNEKGSSLLWVHLVLLWYISITWVLALWWIGKGSLTLRKAQIAKTRNNVIQAKTQARSAPPNSTLASATPLHHDPHTNLTAAHGITSDNSDGWRQRSLMVMNLPATMRDEASIRRYFEEFLRPDDDDTLSTYAHTDYAPQTASHNPDTQHTSVSDAHHPSSCDEHRAAPPTAYSTHSDGPDGPQPDLHPNRYLKSPIQTVVLVRKMNELASMLSRRQEVLTQLEAAHVKLAQEVLVTVGRRTLKMRKQERSKAKEASYPNDHRPSSSRSSFFFNRLLRSRRQSNHSVQAASASSSGTTTPSEALDPDLEKLGTAHSSAGKALEEELARRLARFSPTNRGLHAKQTQTIQGDDRSNQHEMGETVWEALNELPRELLDPFQPATRLSALFRGQTVPTIDYLLTKLNLLTALVTEMRSRPPTSYEPTSTAFVTFRDPRQARMVWRELKDQIVVKVRLAPEVKDLDWDRLMKTSFTVDVVRGFGVSIVTWGFTIFWVIIINAIVLGIFSVDKLKQIPGLGNFFDNNPKLTGFVTITLPPLLVSLASMSVPELIFQVSKRAQGFVTFSALYDMCLARYWKFVICNVVIFFSVGSTVIVTVLTKVGNTGSILSTVASAFPSAAPFFVSYLILQLALQSGFEHMGFMIALLQHLGARKATTPRTRAIKTLPRNFNRYYWLPLHINIMAIVFIFALLNPLVIPFALVYLALALVIFKKNFAYHYYRRFNEMEGVVYFTRLLRYSLDAIVVMQAVLLIFFSVLKKKPVYIGMSAVLIPLTVITKLIATRLWKSQCRALDDEEAEALCGIDSRPLWQKVQRNDMGPSTAEEGSDSRGPLDALASGRYPAIVPPPPTDSAFQRVWQRLHDSFNANGLDGQSYLATAHAKGKAPTGAVSLGAKGIARTPRYIVKETAKHAFHYRHAAKNSLGMKVLVESPRASRDRPSVDRRRPVSGLPPTSQLHVHVLRNSHEVAAATDPAAAADDDDDVDRADGEMPNHRSSNPQRSKSTSHGQKGDHVIHRRRGSSRSEDRPFLSGFDAISTHAPLPSEDDYDLSFEDGDAPFLEHDEQGHLLRQSSRRSKRTASRHHGTLRRKPSQLATVADEELPQSADSATSSTQPEGATSTDPLCQQYASQTAQHAAVKTDQTWGKSSQRSHYEDYDDSLKGRELVRPHPPVRWDDTPNNTARYNNPFYNQEMDDFLWLPRNPLAPIDLFDTIEWYGPALVSSQGGGGIMGEWDDDQDDVNYDTEDEEKLVMHHDEIPFGGEAATLARSQDLMLAGDEEILLPDRLARHLEETQGVEQVVDPAASIPKSMMDDYKRALGRNRDRRGSTTSRSQHSVSRSSLFRRGSNLSSPSAQGFAGGASLLQVPSHGSFCSSDGSQAAASATQMRSSQRPGTGDSEPLASVDEGGVVVPRRSSSRDRRSRDARAGGGEEGGEAYEHVEQGGGGGGAAEQTTDLTPAKRREATLSGVKRNMSRRTYRRDASGALSRVSGISGETAQKTVTLQAALRAEALEEERRLTLKERLVASKIRKKRNVKRDGSGHLAGLEEMNADEEDDDEEEGATSRRAANRSKIMERYEAQHRRREAQASEFGQLTPRKEGGMRRDVSQGSQLGGEVSQSGLDRSASVASGFGARRLRSAALGVLSLTRSPRLGQDGPLTIVTSVPMQELRGGRPTTRGSSRMDAESQASASRQGVAVATASNEDQRPQMVEASNTESVLRAEASRTSALEESVISGGQGGS